ncbi:hypothetical protein [Estrella lausannensis]|uniref:Glycosyltransferase n=1 Tax=Estrella lausannensis TaxID=483423 RepID=A0A0H5DRY5_9BACT|nr:hypothetical protein [Estrella lausannensis]CRX39008.1 hypothetical protein ELAC_1681 [Estrella lausannensis]
MANSVSSDDYFVCVRTIGERTEKCLIDRISKEFPTLPLAVVSDYPSSKTLERAFQLAMESGKKWSIQLDADVLLMPGALQKMFDVLSRFEEKVFAVRFLVADPLLGTIRFAGNQTYRIDHIPYALPFAKQSKEKLRPDRYVIEKMEAKGYLFADVRQEVIGVHDAEQFYRDIYRKCFVYSFKHLNKADEFIPHWRSAESNLDFKVARKGFADGVQHLRQITIDARQMDSVAPDFGEWMKGEGIEEKSPLLSFSAEEQSIILQQAAARHFAALKRKKYHTFY